MGNLSSKGNGKQRDQQAASIICEGQCLVRSYTPIRLKCNFQFKMINRYGALWWCTYELGSTYMCSSCYYTVEKQSRRSCEAERLHSGVHEQSRLFINSKSLFFPDHPTHPS